MSSPATRTAALIHLGFPSGATPTDAELKKAFHKAALKVHPDKGGSPEAFDALTKAYELLTSEASGSSESTANNAEPTLNDLLTELLRQFCAESTSHSNERATSATDTRPICEHFLRGACKFGVKCKNQHPHDTRPICVHFLRGACKFGDKCKNRHDDA